MRKPCHGNQLSPTIQMAFYRKASSSPIIPDSLLTRGKQFGRLLASFGEDLVGIRVLLPQIRTFVLHSEAGQQCLGFEQDRHPPKQSCKCDADNEATNYFRHVPTDQGYQRCRKIGIKDHSWNPRAGAQRFVQ